MTLIKLRFFGQNLGSEENCYVFIIHCKDCLKLFFLSLTFFNNKGQGCTGVQCLNGGTCQNLENNKFMCECRAGYEGQYCEGRNCSKRLSLMPVLS